jgi:hypothetical protein
MDATAEEMLELHKQLDADTSGVLDLNEIKTVVGRVHAIKEAQKARELKLSKDCANAQKEANDLQAAVRAELAEDQRKKDQAKADAVQAALAQQRAEEEAAEAARRKQAAKEHWQKAKQEEFEKRIREKRHTSK